MASILRPVLLPQSFRIVTARKTVAHETSQYPALRHRAWPSLRTQSTASHVLPTWSLSIRRTPPISVQASGYHFSSPRAILPPGLRRWWPITLLQNGTFTDLSCQRSSKEPVYDTSFCLLRRHREAEIGIANDPAPIPDPSPTHGSYHWTFERQAPASSITAKPAKISIPD